jgi:hypothetical protein
MCAVIYIVIVIALVNSKCPLIFIRLLKLYKQFSMYKKIIINIYHNKFISNSA